MELSCEPPMYGLEPAGHSDTIATHQPPARTIEPKATSRWPIRVRQGIAANSR